MRCRSPRAPLSHYRIVRLSWYGKKIPSGKNKKREKLVIILLIIIVIEKRGGEDTRNKNRLLGKMGARV